MPKLPADLPENWTRGQIVSPNGTETGLTEKHGYNYLMKQVNNTQTEVNNINGALPDVAQQATVNEINNKIGTESDADTQPTLFGRLAQLKKVLLEKLAEMLTKVTGIDGKIGTSIDGVEDNTLFGAINGINDSIRNAEGFYRYSKTEIKQQITNWAVIPSGGNSTWIYLKLLHMHAEKSGTIYVKLKATQKAMMRLAIVDKPPLAILTAPDKTNFGMSTPAGLTMEYAMFYWEYVNSAQAVKETEHEWIFPVTAGYDYVFMLTGANVTQLTVDEFLLGYTDTAEA